MKWINEILHRITAKIWVTRLNTRDWKEEDVYEMMKGWIGANPSIRSEIVSAVLKSYSSIKQQKD